MSTVKLSDGGEGSCCGDGGSPPLGGADGNATFILATSNAALPNSRVLGVTSDLSKDVSVAGAITLGLSTATRAELTAATSNISTLTLNLGDLQDDVDAQQSAISTLNTQFLGLAAEVNDLQAINLIAGAGLTGGGTLLGNVTFNVGASDSSITVAADGIALSSALQTAISTNTSNIATLQGRTLSTTAPLQGGGTIGTTNLTLSISAATTAAAGSMSAADKTKLDGLAALTTKGDLLTYTSAAVRLGVGSDGQVLTADSAQAAGVKWATPSSFTSPLTTKGDIFTRSSSADARLAVGTDGQVLTADAASTNGVKWATPTAGGYTTVENNGSAVTARSTINLSTELTATDTASKTAIALTTNGVAYSKLAQAAGLSVLGVTGSSTANLAAIAGTADQVLRVNTAGTALAFGTLAAGAFGNNTISGARLSGFTTNTLPIGVSGGGLGDSTVTLASNALTHSASSSAGTVSATISNTSNTASSHAKLTLSTAGASAGDPTIELNTTATTWTISLLNATNDRFQVLKGANNMLVLDPSAAFNQAQISGNGTAGISISAWSATGSTRNGASLFALGLSSNNDLSIGPSTAGTAGHGVAGIYFDGTNWKRAISWAHVGSVGAGVLALAQDGGNVTVGGATTPASLAGGETMANGTAPSAAPSSAASRWVASGVWHFMGSDGVDTIL